ncbi:MAG: hypothetical protein A3B13_01255 [Candidatus Liptonbacteria bacterium RIFCSPLOWO2_01_FULL_45_15]|uniref:Uncharacterized protein n=1 Tax=Candidatus Liptonbacteria bacterium RIFCSPLOWO2_01_FULL_45_15 TaxID=1798649 RepID=A0A1G2CE58_9BACT|nr:MAG: hypothetical protein A3B13_01255 [Candidatus Liptonbacteria bacterium RIFCSPLOWO2_01_FULL_45_15]
MIEIQDLNNLKCKTRLAPNVQNIQNSKNVGFSSLSGFLTFTDVCQNVCQNVYQVFVMVSAIELLTISSEIPFISAIY